MGPLTDLPDINVWVALSVAEHPHFELAQQYWRDRSGRKVAFCSVTALGLLRILTNRHAMYEKPLTVEAAWQTYVAMRNDPAVVYAREPSKVDLHLARYVESGLVKPRTLTDAHLAATATAGKMRIVSFDSDFERFADVNLLRLSDKSP